ncbi:MAG: hypothetical protein ABJB66_04620 [Gemmatimonadaceae bacterium]
MKRFHLLPLITAVLCVVAPHRLLAQQASPGWHLVYATDSTGARVSGDKATLLAAVRAGQPVRVGWSTVIKLGGDTTEMVESVAQAALLTIYRNEVFAQMPPIMDQKISDREAVVTLSGQGSEGPAWRNLLLDTTGHFRESRAIGRDHNRSTAVYWYVQGTAEQGPDRLK